MGGSGLIVVVIVAAWALFLVPQWLHRRAEAASRLADRIPEGEPEDVPDAEDAPASRRRFGRRVVARRPAASSTGRRWWRRRRALPAVTAQAPASRHAATRTAVGVLDVEHADVEDGLADRGSTHSGRTAAARRRRVLAVLALATLLTVMVVAVAALLGRPLPTWLVAGPGGLMVGYLLLLALVRPGAPQAAPRPVERPHDETAAPAEPPMAAEVTERGEGSETSDPAADTWTPVPLPTPTYVTAPRAPRSVRTIDLSNPGSWTATRLAPGTPASGAAMASVTSHDSTAASGAASAGDGESDVEEWAQRRRAVGD